MNLIWICYVKKVLSLWMDDVAKMDHVGLPPKESFYSKLSQSSISDKEYEHAQKVYQT